MSTATSFYEQATNQIFKKRSNGWTFEEDFGVFQTNQHTETTPNNMIAPEQNAPDTCCTHDDSSRQPVGDHHYCNEDRYHSVPQRSSHNNQQTKYSNSV